MVSIESILSIIATIISSVALVGVAAGLILQNQQLKTSRIQVMREMHLELMKIGIDSRARDSYEVVGTNLKDNFLRWWTAHIRMWCVPWKLLAIPMLVLPPAKGSVMCDVSPPVSGSLRTAQPSVQSDRCLRVSPWKIRVTERGPQVFPTERSMRSASFMRFKSSTRRQQRAGVETVGPEGISDQTHRAHPDTDWLAPNELLTLDTLIAAGSAGRRAEAVGGC